MQSMLQITIINCQIPDPVPKSTWGWFHLLLWFQIMCKSSCVFHVIRSGLMRVYLLCMRLMPFASISPFNSTQSFSHNSISSNIMMNFVYFIRFCLLKYTMWFARCALVYKISYNIMYDAWCYVAYSFYLTNASCELSWWINLFDLAAPQAIITSKFIDYSMSKLIIYNILFHSVQASRWDNTENNLFFYVYNLLEK